jgi:hypothetical protein
MNQIHWFTWPEPYADRLEVESTGKITELVAHKKSKPQSNPILVLILPPHHNIYHHDSGSWKLIFLLLNESEYCNST